MLIYFCSKFSDVFHHLNGRIWSCTKHKSYTVDVNFPRNLESSNLELYWMRYGSNTYMCVGCPIKLKAQNVDSFVYLGSRIISETLYNSPISFLSFLKQMVVSFFPFWLYSHISIHPWIQEDSRPNLDRFFIKYSFKPLMKCYNYLLSLKLLIIYSSIESKSS